MVGDQVHRAHPLHRLGVVGPAEEEDLPGELLADHPGQVGRAEPGVERADIRVGLLEPGVLPAGDGQVADHVQAVPTAGRPAGDDGNHHLGHHPDQPLHLQDVQPAAVCRGPGGIHRLGGLAERAGLVGRRVLVAGAPTDPLVAAGAERPAAVLAARAVAGDQYAADVRRHPGVVEHPVELVDGVRPEGVTHLGPVERHPHGAAGRPGQHAPVVGQVGELEPCHRLPGLRVEDLGHGCAGHLARIGAAGCGSMAG